MPNRVGQRLGNYRLLRMIGRGGFAEVYLAEHVFLKIQAAIKVLQIQLAKDDLENFVKEARFIASLVHPHIIRVLEFGVEGVESEVEMNIPFLVMDYAPNGTLRQRHPKGTRLSLATILPYIKQIAEALSYAHQQRLVHRDIKPENMLVGRNNDILLSDFGIALVSSTSQNTQTMAGTVAYMAPEQVMGKPHQASDQYALGVVIYEWLCGEHPFSGSFGEIATQQMFASPPPLNRKGIEISPAIEEVVMTALAKDPQRRFKTILAFANALEQADEGVPERRDTSTFVRPPSPSISDPSSAFATTLHAPETPDSSLVTPPLAGLPTPRIVDTTSTQPVAESIPTPPLSDSASISSAPDLTYLSPYSNPTLKSVRADPPSTPPVLPIVSAQPSPTSLPIAASSPSSLAPPSIVAARTPRRKLLSRRAFVAGAASTVVLGGGILAWLLYHGESTRTSASNVGTILLTYHGHIDGVTALAWSPDSKHIASGSNDHTVQIWDPVDGKTLLTRRGYSGGVSAVAWSPDSTLITSASSAASVSGGPAGDHTVQVWNAVNGLPVFIYRGHSGGITSLAWSPKAMRIASSSVDFTLQMWDATTGKHPLIYRTHSWYVWTVAWSPDDTHIASGSPDGSVQIWNAITAATPRILRGHTDGVESVAWSPNGQFIASASDDFTVRVWNAMTGNTIHILRGHSSFVRKVAWSPDGIHIATGSSDKTVRLWDATSGNHIYTYEGHANGVTSLAWSPDNTRIASASSDKTVQVWKAN